MITLVIFHSKLLHCQIVGQARNQVLVQPGSRQQACLWVGGEATATGPSTSCFRCMWLWVEERYGTFQLDLTWKLEVASRWIAVEFLGLYIYTVYIYIQIYIYNAPLRHHENDRYSQFWAQSYVDFPVMALLWLRQAQRNDLGHFCYGCRPVADLCPPVAARKFNLIDLDPLKCRKVTRQGRGHVEPGEVAFACICNHARQKIAKLSVFIGYDLVVENNFTVHRTCTSQRISIWEILKPPRCVFPCFSPSK